MLLETMAGLSPDPQGGVPTTATEPRGAVGKPGE